MNYLEKLGKRRTIALSISILLLSLYSTYIYQAAQPSIDISKLISQIIRFFLTIGLLIFVYEGKKWARIVSLILFAIAIILALSAIFTINHSSIFTEIPFYVMIFIYSDAIFHFGFSKSYKAFCEYQRRKFSVKSE